MSDVKVRRIKSDSDHNNQKWYVIEGYIEGVPQVTKRDTINIAAIASGDVSLDARIQKMRDDVAEYYARLQALESLPEDL